MNITITPRKLSGRVLIPSSKSMTHREFICAALAEGESVIDNVSLSNDITATARAMAALGAEITEIPSAYPERAAFCVAGGLKKSDFPVTLDCGESGSTLRFLIPIALHSGNRVTFVGHGRLAERPLTPYYEIFDEKKISYKTAGGLPLTAEGKLASGRYALPGDVSSQFFTGLLFVLPLLSGNSVLESTTALESASYIDMTVECMARHGVRVENPERGRYEIAGGQRYRAGHFDVEGDYSQSAFWLTAGILGNGITSAGLSEISSQGDRVICEILARMGGNLVRNEKEITAFPSKTHGTVIDAEDCPDLVPVLAALASVSEGTTEIIHAARVRLKECDRLRAMAVELSKLGADISEKPDGLVIRGKERLSGGTCDAWNDHRVAMALASVSSQCESPLTILGAECVSKSYPAFWKDFEKLGGEIAR